VSKTPAADGTPLALHRWMPARQSDVRGLLYYVHGIQSHAGWLFETGPELARRGVATYALDRRGSALSGGIRGDLPSAATVTDDYLAGLRAARASLPGRPPVTVLGQSFGGSIVASLAAGGALSADRLVYCCPALGQQRARHGADRLAGLRAMTGMTYSPIALEDEDYTDQARYLEFMANDVLMQRQITARGRATMVELELTYTGRKAAGPAEVHFVRTAADPVIALDVSARALAALHGEFTTVTFPIKRHYVEFSPARRDYWDWLTGIAVLSSGGAAARGTGGER
jgi:alpha-beta hydrolase superfamily lysophospholipase